MLLMIIFMPMRMPDAEITLLDDIFVCRRDADVFAAPSCRFFAAAMLSATMLMLR